MALTTSPPRTDYTSFKSTIHRKLIQSLNLERLAQMDREAALLELTRIIEKLMDTDGMPITLLERERLARGGRAEILRARASGAADAGPDRFGHSGQHGQARLR